MDMREFLGNRGRVTTAEIQMHAGKYVAWSPDGTRIIASSEDPLQLIAAVKSSGFEPSECVLSSIPLADEAIVGGGVDE
ncbi:MAG: hypothetical protein FJ271_09025 [Planctomycetes bacterium]|nr:hypothetical protein [Planctomycetota bacterium]